MLLGDSRKQNALLMTHNRAEKQGTDSGPSEAGLGTGADLLNRLGSCFFVSFVNKRLHNKDKNSSKPSWQWTGSSALCTTSHHQKHNLFIQLVSSTGINYSRITIIKKHTQHGANTFVSLLKRSI